MLYSSLLIHLHDKVLQLLLLFHKDIFCINMDIAFSNDYSHMQSCEVSSDLHIQGLKKYTSHLQYGDLFNEVTQLVANVLTNCHASRHLQAYLETNINYF